MARRPAVFTQGDVTRAVKGVLVAGAEVSEVLINATGAIEIRTGKPDESPKAENENDPNPWDTI